MSTYDLTPEMLALLEDDPDAVQADDRIELVDADGADYDCTVSAHRRNKDRIRGANDEALAADLERVLVDPAPFGPVETDPDAPKPKVRRGPDGKWLPGTPSPYPRAFRGHSRSQTLRRILNDAGPKVVMKVVELALAGDSMACRTIVDKIVPSLRAVAPTAHIPQLVEATTLTEKATAVVDSVGAGLLPGDVGALLLQGLGALAKVKEIDQLEARLAALEKRNA